MPKASDKTASETTGRRSKAPAKAPAKATAKAPASAPAKAPTKASTRKPVAKAAPQDAQANARPKRPRVAATAKSVPVDAAAAVTSQRNTMPGARLIKKIKKVIIDRGLPDRAIADVMGITVIYWNSLANGNRQIRSLGKDKLQLVAEFLGLPLIQVYNLADFFSPKDFVYTKDLDEQLWLSIEKMGSDPTWAGYIPKADEWEKTPLSVRMTMVLLYEQLSNRQLLAKAEIELPQVAVSPAV